MNEHWPRETVSLREHINELKACEEKLTAERDRRYSEVNVEREKALKIKEEADKVALDLAREIQVYKDTKANELREQISSERGLYATKSDLRQESDKIVAIVTPLAEFVSSQRGAQRGILGANAIMMGLISVALVVVSILINVFVK